MTTCGNKKKKMAEARLKAGRKRLADVILELQASPSFDSTVLQQQLMEVSFCMVQQAPDYAAQVHSISHKILRSSESLAEKRLWNKQVDGVLCGMDEPCMSSSSSSSSSEDEDMQENCSQVPMMQSCADTEVSEVRSSNVVPMIAKLKKEKIMPIKKDALEVVSNLLSGARVSVCQGKACSKRGSAQLMEELSMHAEEGVEVMPCKCLDKCKAGPNLEVTVGAEKRIVAVNAPAQKVLVSMP